MFEVQYMYSAHMYTQTSFYGHIYYTGTSLLWTVYFV